MNGDYICHLVPNQLEPFVQLVPYASLQDFREGPLYMIRTVQVNQKSSRNYSTVNQLFSPGKLTEAQKVSPLSSYDSKMENFRRNICDCKYTIQFADSGLPRKSGHSVKMRSMFWFCPA